MAGKFERKRFSEINLNDPFFDSLKADYPGTSSSTGFVQWFAAKAADGKRALIFEDDQGVGAFVNLKPNEAEEINLANGSVLPKTARLKITTIKIDERYRNQRIGEGALGLTLWQWRDLGINEIYVTVFDKHISLILLLEKYGFIHVGNNLNGERVYIKDRRNLDFSDPCKSFPFLSGQVQHAGCLAIDMEYHDTMFASSDLANTLQERVDISVANGLKKVYIGKPYSLAFKVGEPVLVYRKYTGTGGRPGYKSVITTYCVATRIEKIKVNGRAQYSYDQFLRMVGNKSVYNEDELKEKYDTWDSPAPQKEVVGEALIDEILEGTPKEIWEIAKTTAGITKKFYFSYYSGKDKAIAYKLKNVVIYEKLKALSDYGIRQAPQSFVYL